MGDPIPTRIELRRAERVLAVSFDDGECFELPCEYLRVYSPSAEVRGHAPGQEQLPTDKQQVGIVAIEPIGNYAVKLAFDDGHDSGIYSWDLLYDLGSNREQYWQAYLEALVAFGTPRSG